MPGAAVAADLTVHQVLCLSLVLGGLALLAWLALRSRRPLDGRARALLVLALGVLPPLTFVLSQTNVVERAKHPDACVSCHLMVPYGDDMDSRESRTLAAVHHLNNRLHGNGCYDCHTQYGVFGGLKGQLAGARHLGRYLTNAYELPLQVGAADPGESCLRCHLRTPVFEAAPVHAGVREPESAEACYRCHGRPHPELRPEDYGEGS